MVQSSPGQRGAEEAQRATADAWFAAIEAHHAAESPRMLPVQHEPNQPSAAGFVEYENPETISQEVAMHRHLRRQDVGTGTEGPGASVFVQEPAQHARLPVPAATHRSSRLILQRRDRAMAADKAVVPLPRPYLTRGEIESLDYPYQYHGKGIDRPKISRQVFEQAPALIQAARDLQDRLGTRRGQRMLRADVQVAADLLYVSSRNHYANANEILTTMQDLRQNWYPTETIIHETGIGEQIRKLVNHNDRVVASLARAILAEWQEKIRSTKGRKGRVNTVVPDPFVDEGAELYGQIIPREAWDQAIREKEKAVHDHNAYMPAATCAAVLRDRRRREREQKAKEAEFLRVYQEKGIFRTSASNPNEGILHSNSRARARAQDYFDNEESGNGRDPDSTITDPNEAALHSGSRHFDIFESDPSPERSQPDPGNTALQVHRLKDVPMDHRPANERDIPTDVCHPCPVFPKAIHHVCAPANANCAAKVSYVRKIRRSPSYVSQSPPPSQEPSHGLPTVRASKWVREDDYHFPDYAPAQSPRARQEITSLSQGPRQFAQVAPGTTSSIYYGPQQFPQATRETSSSINHGPRRSPRLRRETSSSISHGPAKSLQVQRRQTSSRRSRGYTPLSELIRRATNEGVIQTSNIRPDARQQRARSEPAATAPKIVSRKAKGRKSRSVGAQSVRGSSRKTSSRGRRSSGKTSSSGVVITAVRKPRKKRVTQVDLTASPAQSTTRPSESGSSPSVGTKPRTRSKSSVEPETRAGSKSSVKSQPRTRSKSSVASGSRTRRESSVESEPQDTSKLSAWTEARTRSDRSSSSGSADSPKEPRIGSKRSSPSSGGNQSSKRQKGAGGRDNPYKWVGVE